MLARGSPESMATTRRQTKTNVKPLIVSCVYFFIFVHVDFFKFEPRVICDDSLDFQTSEFDPGGNVGVQSPKNDLQR